MKSMSVAHFTESPELQRSQIPQQQMSGSPAQPKFSLREHLTGLFRPPKSGTVPQEQQQSGSDGNEPRSVVQLYTRFVIVWVLSEQVYT